MRNLPGLTVILLALSAGLSSASAQELEITAPDVFLKNVGFTVRVDASGSLDSVPVTLRTADGLELGQASLAPLGSVTFADLFLESSDQLPLEVVTPSGVITVSRPLLPGWVSILPPLVAIALALVFREVVLSLFAGIWLGCFLLVGYNPLAALLRAVDRYAMPQLADGEHASIIVFSLMLGGMVGVLTRMGAARALVDKVATMATTPRRGQFATWLAGLAIFFDDYANTLVVGNTMRPLTDRLKVSREKLAYIVDSTAAPVAAIFFVSTWIGYEIGLIDNGLRLAATQNLANPELVQQLESASAFGVFLHTIPYLFYPILALLMVLVVALLRRDFGPMLLAERRAGSGGGVFRPGAQLAAEMSSELAEPTADKRPYWWIGAVPVATVVITVLVGLYHTGIQSLPENEPATLSNIIGNSDPFTPLLWGSLLGCMAAILLAVGQRSLSLAESIQAWVSGIRMMILAVIILVLAWSLGAVTESLETAPFLAGALSERLPMASLPPLVFVVAAAAAFATGTSWATMAILLPLVVPLSVAFVASSGAESILQHPVVLGAIASVLAGAIFGDHCSPISDTTVMSSMASGCDHLDHVRTQLPYALVVAVVALVVGSVPTSLGLSPWISLLMGGVGIWAFTRFYGKISAADAAEVQRAPSAIL